MCTCALTLEPVALRRRMAYLITDPRLVTTAQSIDVVFNAGVYMSERAKRPRYAILLLLLLMCFWQPRSLLSEFNFRESARYESVIRPFLHGQNGGADFEFDDCFWTKLYLRASMRAKMALYIILEIYYIEVFNLC